MTKIDNFVLALLLGIIALIIFSPITARNIYQLGCQLANTIPEPETPIIVYLLLVIVYIFILLIIL